jgi:hypothetical protein
MKALGRYGKLLEDGTRRAADTTGNFWHHRTFPHILSDPLLLITYSPAGTDACTICVLNSPDGAKHGGRGGGTADAGDQGVRGGRARQDPDVRHHAGGDAPQGLRLLPLHLVRPRHRHALPLHGAPRLLQRQPALVRSAIRPSVCTTRQVHNQPVFHFQCSVQAVRLIQLQSIVVQFTSDTNQSIISDQSVRFASIS